MAAAGLAVAIDARPLADPTNEAFPYALHLTHALAYVDRETTFHLFVDRELAEAVVPRGANLRGYVLSGRGALWKLVKLPAAAERIGATVLHVQGLPPSAGVPVVSTIRHLAPLDHPERYPRAVAWAWRDLLPRQLARTAAVLTPWRHVASQLTERFAVAPERIEVTPYGVESRFSPQCETVVGALRARAGLPERYVLARAAPPSAQRDVVEIWRRGVAAHGLGTTLVFLGAAPEAPGVLAAVVDDAALPALLSGADAVLLGRPGEAAALAALEAAACGTPVVGPPCPLVAEALGPIATLGDPERQAEGLAALPAAGERQAETAAERVAGRTWPAMAEATLAVYRRVAGI